MNSLLVLFAGDLKEEAFEPLLDGKNSISLAAEQAKKFPGAAKIVLLTCGGDFSFLRDIQIEQSDKWTKKTLLEKIAELQGSGNYDFTFFAFADCPFLDPVPAASMAERHLKYAAEYSYADGFPFGLTPEIISPGTAAILAKINGEDEGKVERDFLFSVIQKDINAFDIETEISKTDLRCHRLNLCADSKRNLLLLKNFIKASGGKLPSSFDAENIIEKQPEILRTLPSFFPIQVYGGCPQKCSLCPYPAYTNTQGSADFMEAGIFESLIDKIAAFSKDAVIDLSLWGELSLHPEKMKLIEKVILKPGLSLVIETSGVGWRKEELLKCVEFSQKKLEMQDSKKNPIAPLSWIVSLDTIDPKRYGEIRGAGFAQAQECAKTLLSLFPKDCYVQAVRTKGCEDDTEKFYRYWKENSPNGEKNIIIQKYDDFCGCLEKRQASDISPLTRKPCWHIMRDIPVLIDGTVPLCREDLSALKNTEGRRVLGNAFKDSFEQIWKNGEYYYKEHCTGNYTELCANCDEYYTYNF